VLSFLPNIRIISLISAICTSSFKSRFVCASWLGLSHALLPCYQPSRLPGGWGAHEPGNKVSLCLTVVPLEPLLWWTSMRLCSLRVHRIIKWPALAHVPGSLPRCFEDLPEYHCSCVAFPHCLLCGVLQSQLIKPFNIGLTSPARDCLYQGPLLDSTDRCHGREDEVREELAARGEREEVDDGVARELLCEALMQEPGSPRRLVRCRRPLSCAQPYICASAPTCCAFRSCPVVLANSALPMAERARFAHACLVTRAIARNDMP
jgi:hypothetical protein